MKKISLKNLNLKEVEQLSREQLKNVLGGADSGSGDPYPKITACKGKDEGDACSWTTNGTNYTGKCKTLFGPRHCSDL